MKMPRRSSRLALASVAFLALLVLAPRVFSADTNLPAPPGVVDFAGRAARNHWNLFGEEKRASLETLNRELREAKQGFERARDDEARRTNGIRLRVAASNLLELVKGCAQIKQVDLNAERPALAPGGPMELPGDTGALLIKVQAGGEGLSYSTTVFDLSLPSGESSVATVDVAESGTTYALLGIERLPFGRTMMAIEFKRPDKPTVRLPLDITTPPPGRLKLTVLSDDDGKPGPAMVRLMSRYDGQVRQPANGIEFGLQFDKQGKASGARNANLPGQLADSFWCVPGPFDMTLPPGQWQLGVRRGVEHEAVFEELTVRSGETITRTIRPKRWTDMRPRGWWSGDDHVHCRILSDADARNLMAWVQAEDIHFANVVKMGDIYRTYFEQRGFGRDYRVVEGDFALVPGQECPRTHDQIGHTLAMNITSMVRNTERYFLYDEVFDAVHAQGGLSGYAHINSGLFHVHRDMTLNVPRQKVDFAEILQFNLLGTELYYDFLNLGCKLTASCGSDVPWGGTVGEVRVYACLEQQPFSADAWLAAFQRGRTFTTSGPMIEFRVDEAKPGDEIHTKPGQQLRIRARAWGDPQRTDTMKLEIVRHGEVIRTVESSEVKQPVAELDFTVDAGEGCWIAARARASSGTSAHTTPVYAVREGLRFWKYDGLEALFEKRLASLSEIEEIVAEAKRLDAEGKLAKDRYRKQLALQGDLLLERVTQARKLYADLKRTAEKERSLRAATK